MARRFREVVLIATVAGAMLVAPAVAAAQAIPPMGAVLSRQEPWHDPHCTRDGRWHNDQRDQRGHPDPRCPRW
jgi:hypothetical protein